MAFKSAFVIFTALLAAVHCRPCDDEIDCSSKADGIYSIRTDKRGFYVCMSEGVMAQMQCTEGSVFDESRRNCIKENASEEDDDENALDQKEHFTQDELDDTDKIKEEVTKFLEKAEHEPFVGENGTRVTSKYKVYNVVVTENIFPKSVVVIGKAQREQKNI